MKLYAHVTPDGSIQCLVVEPEGDRSAGVVPEPGVQVCEIQNHGITNEATADQLARILATKSVAITPAQGKLVARKK